MEKKAGSRSISPARTAAFDALMKIETERAFSSSILPKFTEKLEPRDRNLAYEISLGVLRRKLFLDRAIDQRSGGRKLDAEVRTALRIGLYQLLYLDKVPSHSAINESVELVVRAKKVSAKGFVNAVLRTILREGFELEHVDELDRVSAETSHPRWLLERWSDEFGKETAFAIAEANNRPPRVSFRRTILGAEESLPPNIERSEIVENCFFAGGDVSSFRILAGTGRIYYQDEGSQLVGQIVASQNGKILFDVAAAPGSKTTQIAAFGKFDRIFAGDLYSYRIKALAENCAVQGVEGVHILQYNAGDSLPFSDETFDVVLLDAPCSGTGTIRHNPEIRYVLAPSDLAELSSKQRKMLSNASKTVKRGGRLLYSTCSLESIENEEVISEFLKSNPSWRNVVPNVPERLLTDLGNVRTFPDRDDMDGFFVAVLERE